MTRAPKPPSRLEDRFLKLWRLACGPELEKEYRFDSERRWSVGGLILPISRRVA
jgi:hypothetical protein